MTTASPDLRLSKTIQAMLLEKSWAKLDAEALGKKATKALNAIHGGDELHLLNAPHVKDLARRLVDAASQCPGALARMLDQGEHFRSIARRAEILSALTPSQRRSFLASGELRWAHEPVAHHLHGSMANATLAKALAKIFAAATSEDPDFAWDGQERVALLREHLALSSQGADARRGAVGAAMKWIQAHPAMIKTGALARPAKARLERALALTGCSPEQAQALRDALAKAKAASTALRDAAADAGRWGAPAAWAIRGDHDDILGHIQQGALAAGIDFATRAFEPASDLSWNRPPPSEHIPPPALETLLERALGHGAHRCALALAALPGASRPYFDDAGEPLRRSPLGLMRAHLAIEGPKGEAASRLAQISLLFAEDLLARGLERARCAEALRRNAEAALANRDKATTPAKARLESATMRLAAALSDWSRSSDAAPSTSAKRRAKSL